MSRVLVVDDDPAVRKALTKVLRRAGFAAISARHGRHALATLRKQDVQAVVSDIRMPDMDGMQFFEALCRSRPELARRVLFITAWSRESDVKRFLEHSSCPFLEKPFEMDELVEAVENVIASAPDPDSAQPPNGSSRAGRDSSITYLSHDAAKTGKTDATQIKPRRPSVERRAKPRSSQENVATSIVQSIVRDPTEAAEVLLDDLDAGGDPEVVLGLLDAAEAMLKLRGSPRSSTVTALRKRIERYVG